MQILSDLRELTPNQRNAVLFSFLGWTLDSFDFFIIVFVLRDIANEFKTDIPSVTATLFLTLAMRPLGAFLFGIAADRFGRRPTLMINILFYSFVELLSGFAPTLTALIILRALVWYRDGRRMGCRCIAHNGNRFPPKTRGIVSGIAPSRLSKRLFAGSDPVRHCFSLSRLARNVYGRRACRRSWCCSSARNVEESPAWQEAPSSAKLSPEATIKGNWKPLSLCNPPDDRSSTRSATERRISIRLSCRCSKNFPLQIVSTIAVIYNLGAILGGLVLWCVL